MRNARLILVAIVGAAHGCGGGRDSVPDADAGPRDARLADDGAVLTDVAVPDAQRSDADACAALPDPRLAWAYSLEGGPALELAGLVALPGGGGALLGTFGGALRSPDGALDVMARGVDASSLTDLFLLRVDADGRSGALLTAGGATTRARGVDVADDGSLVVGASFMGAGRYGPDETVYMASGEGAASFLARHAPDGSVQRLSTLPGAVTRVLAVHADGAGGVLVAGDMEGRGHLARYDAGGALLWSVTDAGDRMTAIAALPSGDWLVAGHFTRGVTLGRGQPGEVTLTEGDHGQAYVSRWSPAGALVSARALENLPSPNSISVAAASADGSYVLAGRVRGSVPTTRETPLAWLRGFAPDGTERWAFTLGGSTASSFRGIEPLDDGNVLVAGAVETGASFLRSPSSVPAPAPVGDVRGPSDGFVARIAPSGAVQAVLLVGGAGSDELAGVQALDATTALVGGIAWPAADACPAGLLPWPPVNTRVFVARITLP